MSELLSLGDGPCFFSNAEEPQTEQAAHKFFAGLDDPIADLALRHGPIDFALPSHDTIPPDHIGDGSARRDAAGGSLAA